MSTVQENGKIDVIHRNLNMNERSIQDVMTTVHMIRINYLT